MPILYTFYGDDFTGSTDVLEQLASNGVRAVLFLRLPTEDHLVRFPDAQAIGIAGDSRSRSPKWMDAHLPAIFERMRRFGAPVNHYKVCSTFDSSPHTGSIGRAIELGLCVFPETPFVPIVVAAPHLRRYVAFANLFAAAPDGTIQRIDRHPMSRHPVTPMKEADLRRHLALQTTLAVASFDSTKLTSDRTFDLQDSSVVLFDGIDSATHANVGRFIWQQARNGGLFSASSSGLTSALIEAWRADGTLVTQAAELAHTSLPQSSRPDGDPLLVVSGSCSLATEQQIRWSLANGFRGISIDPHKLLHNAEAGKRLLDETISTMRSGRSMVLYTAMGTAEGAVSFGEELGRTLGDLLQQMLRRHPIPRVLLCGGDTCSHAVQQLGLDALTWAANLWPGAPLCRAHAAASALDGLELVLKGGQVGREDFFALVRDAIA